MAIPDRSHKKPVVSVDQLLQHAYLFISEGSKEKALAVLDGIQAEGYGRLALVLETSGQLDLALAYWKLAYATHSGW